MRMSARPIVILTSIAAMLVALTARSAAQQRPASAAPADGVKWRSIGPVNTSGRIDDFAVARVPGQPDAIYVATASGGVFKSTNAGTSWTPIFDNVNAMMSIGDITVAPSSPTTVWVGTGEANNRQSSSWGDGVYKSTDAGKTWTNMGLTDTKHIGRIVIDPLNANVVYVAAGGHLWGKNAERGVFKTVDGGATWTKSLFIDDKTGATDIVIDPKNPKVLIAAMYQRERTSWGFNGGGPGSGIFKTTDAGATWKRLTKGLPTGDLGRISLDMFPADPKLVFATVEAKEGGVFRSQDAGETWEAVSKQNTRPSYFSQIRVDPKYRNRVYTLGSNRGFYVSNDSAKTFVDTGVNGIHGEDHALWVDPDNTNHLIIGGDGGVSISWDRGITWDFRMNMPIGQFYEIDVDMKTPFTVCGGLQDNGEWCVPSAVRDRNGIAARDGWNIGGGDGFYVKFDPSDQNFAYAESQDGNASRVNLRTMERTSVKPPNPAGTVLRWNWDTPIVISSADPKTLYMAAQMVFRSTDQGRTWTAISGDLTGGVDHPAGTENPPADALSRNDGTSPFASLTSLSESPLDAKVLYAGAQDGTVQVTRDGGKTWTNITSKFPGVPKNTYVSTVLASQHVAGRAYVTFDGHYTDDFKPYLFVTEDFGQTWKSTGIVSTAINRVREHPRNANVLVAGTEKGAFYSNDRGATWTSLSLKGGFPTVSVDDIVIHPRDNALVLGTHGRGIWILDDMGTLEVSAQMMQGDAVLAPIAPARQIITTSPQAWFGTGTFFAPNPDFNAGFNYFIRDGASGNAQIDIADRFGNVVRTLQGPVAKGFNHATWDLRGNPPVAAPDAAGRVGAAGRGGGGGRGGGAAGPLVTPGTYIVTITIPGIATPLRGEVKVEADPWR